MAQQNQPAPPSVPVAVDAAEDLNEKLARAEKEVSFRQAALKIARAQKKVADAKVEIVKADFVAAKESVSCGPRDGNWR
jgi:hypothetical protein